MRQPDAIKRHSIMEAAAALFGSRPFHEVKLDEVAAAAHVGKGTLYVYFSSKEELYAALVYEGFAQLVDRLLARIGAAAGKESAWADLELVVRELVSWSRRYPDFFNLMRAADVATMTPPLREKRKELGKLIETVIRRGIRTGELSDPRPELTAQFVPACVRTAIRNGPTGLSQETLVRHILRVLGGGIVRQHR